MPIVSVLLVFHRHSPYLREAVASVLRQTFADLELVLVDNGSGLAPEALGESAADSRLRWVRLPRNDGIPAGHNAGVTAARGEFIALLDYDDVALPRRLEHQIAVLGADTAVGLVASCAERIDETGTVVDREFSLLAPAAQFAYTQYAAPVVTPAYTGRREVFASLPYRAEFPLSADFDFLARAAERWSMAAAPEVLLQYRWHAGQATQQHRVEIERSRCAVRLLTARRRARRPEDVASALDMLAGSNSAADTCRLVARCCLAEKFPTLAAYHARRSLALERTVASATAAARLAAAAVAQARGIERTLAARMFFSGPVRALGLRAA